jgi:protein required for attachment to host cells
MILPQGAVVAVVDGAKLVMFHNIGHEAEVDLKAMDLPAVEPGAASRGHHFSGANPDDDTQARRIARVLETCEACGVRFSPEELAQIPA